MTLLEFMNQSPVVTTLLAAMVLGALITLALIIGTVFEKFAAALHMKWSACDCVPCDCVCEVCEARQAAGTERGTWLSKDEWRCFCVPNSGQNRNDSDSEQCVDCRALRPLEIVVRSSPAPAPGTP